MKMVSLNSIAKAKYGCPYDGLTRELQKKCKIFRKASMREIFTGSARKGYTPSLINPVGRKARRTALKKNQIKKEVVL